MKKAITVFSLVFCLSNYSQAQVDTSKTMTDTSMMDHNKTHQKMNRNQDSINNKRKMPQRRTTGITMGHDSTMMTEHPEINRKEKPSNSSPKS